MITVSLEIPKHRQLNNNQNSQSNNKREEFWQYVNERRKISNKNNGSHKYETIIRENLPDRIKKLFLDLASSGIIPNYIEEKRNYNLFSRVRKNNPPNQPS